MGCFFFFQAEDGIRDRNVTGVQTCALPICPAARAGTRAGPGARRARDRRRARSPTGSEERRVGKECRSRWSPSHKTTKKQEKKNKRDRKRKKQTKNSKKHKNTKE